MEVVEFALHIHKKLSLPIQNTASSIAIADFGLMIVIFFESSCNPNVNGNAINLIEKTALSVKTISVVLFLLLVQT